MKRSGEQFIHEKDSSFHTSDPVESTQKRRKERGEKISQKPSEKIGDYFDRLENVLNPEPLEGHEDFDRKQRNLDLLKERLYENVIIDEEDIPEGYFKNLQRLERERGHGDVEITDEMRKQHAEVIVADQKSTLDNWADYLSSDDSNSFPMWAKHWAFAGMLKLSTYDKEKKSFGKRDKGTVAPFADLNREALAYTVDAINKRVGKEELPNADDPEFQKILKGANFGKLYAWAIEKVTPAEEHELLNTEGEWVKYDQGADHMPLVESLQGHGTGWCTAGESTAQDHLQGGDFHVYYSNDKEGKSTIPRVAIRMDEDHIAEVRGIAPDQNLDSHIANTDLLDNKLDEFNDGENYKKRTADTKQLTEIDKKHQSGEELTKEDLVFLYEIEDSIEGLGYSEDPRIWEIKNQRAKNIDRDMLTIFECSSEQVVHHNLGEVNKNTKAFVGQIAPDTLGYLKKMNIEHVYTEFPDGKVKIVELSIGGRTKETIINELHESNMHVNKNATDLLKNDKVEVQKEKENVELVFLKLSDLSGIGWEINKDSTLEVVISRAEMLGLEVCSAEDGFELATQYDAKSMNDNLIIMMKPVINSTGQPQILEIKRATYEEDDNVPWLSAEAQWLKTPVGGSKYDSRKLVFRLPPMDEDDGWGYG